LVQNLALKPQEVFFWGTHAGAEIDLIWQAQGKWWGAEFKYANAPTLTKSTTISLNDLKLNHVWVIYPGDKKYPLSPEVSVLPLKDVGIIRQMISRVD